MDIEKTELIDKGFGVAKAVKKEENASKKRKAKRKSGNQKNDDEIYPEVIKPTEKVLEPVAKPRQGKN